MEIIIAILALVAGAVAGPDTAAYGTAVQEPAPVVSTITVGSDGSLASFAG